MQGRCCLSLVRAAREGARDAPVSIRGRNQEEAERRDWLRPGHEADDSEDMEGCTFTVRRTQESGSLC